MSINWYVQEYLHSDQIFFFFLKVINSKMQLQFCSLQPYKADKTNVFTGMAVIQISDRTCEQYKTEAFPRIRSTSSSRLKWHQYRINKWELNACYPMQTYHEQKHEAACGWTQENIRLP